MAKAKYRLDQHLKTESVSGTVTEVRLRKDEVKYVLDDNSEVTESDVLGAYRLIQPRKPKAEAAPRSRSKKAT